MEALKQSMEHAQEVGEGNTKKVERVFDDISGLI
jgi:hypothetical protein